MLKLEAGLLAVDTHAHIFRRGLSLASGRRYAPDYDAELSHYLGLLDRYGIARGVLVQPSFLGSDNSFLLEGLRQAPDRLRGIAVVEPGVATAELERMAAAGVVGIRLNLVGVPLPDLNSSPWQEQLSRLAALGWQVEVHRPARDLQLIMPPLLDAGVDVVVDHFGLPDPRLGVADAGFRYLLELAATGRVWVKLSAAYRNGVAPLGVPHADTTAALLRQAFGPARLLWGSDWPHTQHERSVDYGQTITALQHWLPDEAERRIVLQDTPAALYRFA
jgi:predicted TIM-barrel fold metal-dependent hydrolase